MIEEDYLLRMIHQMIRAIFKILFHYDTDVEETINFSDEKSEGKYRDWIAMAREGKINSAENFLYESLDLDNVEDLKAALMFYDYLSGLDEDFLQQANFSREEIRDGITHVLSLYGYEGFSEMFE